MEEISLEQWAKAWHSGDLNAITEASLGRVYQHVKRAEGGTSFAVLTAYRDGVSTKENQANQRKLEKAIRDQGLGFFKLTGFWKECQDPTMEYNDCPESMKVPVREPSMFVPKMQLDNAVKLGKKFDQDSIIYAGEETGGKVALYGKNGQKQATLGTFHPNTMADAYSMVKGKTFTFEGVGFKPNSYMSRMAFDKLMGQLIEETGQPEATII